MNTFKQFLINLEENFKNMNTSPYERGQADSYYMRNKRPHKVVAGKDIENLSPEEVEEYNKGFEENESQKTYKYME
jgi:hypothetical protein